VTHSLCTLEFEINRELYDWVVESCDLECRPYQTEFARLELDYIITSKRKLLQLVEKGVVTGWDDPRLPTLTGLRRRGVTPEAIRALVDLVGVARTNSRVDLAKLEFAIRDDLNTKARRVMCVVNPLRVVITNWPDGETDTFDAPYWPHDVPKEGTRPLPFGGEILIERDDFMQDPLASFHRLAPGREVRLRHAWVIRCDDVVRNDTGDIVELRCTYDPETRGGATPDGRTIKGTIHWVSAAHAVPCEVRLYDRLFNAPQPGSGEDGDFMDDLNPDSLVVASTALIEPAIADDPAGTRYQFERLGYFMSDTVDSKPDALVFNRIVTLRDTWKKIAEPTAPSTGRPKRDRDAKPQPPSTPAAERDRSPEVEERYRLLVARHDLPSEDADVLARDAAAVALFDAAVAAWPGPNGAAKPLANWIIHELPREAGERPADELPFGGRELAALVSLAEDGTLSSSGARDVLAVLAREGGDPAAIVERLGLRQVSGEAELEPVVTEVLAANPGKVEDYRSGRTGLMGFFVGQVMRRTGGRANPEVTKQLLERALSG
jgi:glutaminyl-tRNA synthetase